MLKNSNKKKKEKRKKKKDQIYMCVLIYVKLGFNKSFKAIYRF
jgi:hypothetical protein